MLLLHEFYRRMVNPAATFSVAVLTGKHPNVGFAGLQWRYVLNGGTPVLGCRVLPGELQEAYGTQRIAGLP